jgi:hypothetical protein
VPCCGLHCGPAVASGLHGMGMGVGGHWPLPCVEWALLVLWLSPVVGAVVWTAGQCVVSRDRQQQQLWLVVSGVSCVVGCGAGCGVLAIGVWVGVAVVVVVGWASVTVLHASHPSNEGKGLWWQRCVVYCV